MKFRLHGILFNIWVYFFLFSLAIVGLLGLLQFSLIEPYYRNSQIRTVEHVSDEIQGLIIERYGDADNVLKATQLTVDNSVCVAIYNDQGKKVYSADALGSGCVFNTASSVSETGDLSFNDGNSLKEYLNEHKGECSINLTNERTAQEMIVYGRTITGTLGSFYLFVNSPLQVGDSIIDFFSQQYLYYTLIVVFFGSLISFAISRSIVKPIVNMKQEAVKLAHADYSAHFEGGRFSEVKELAENLNGATDKLSKIDELRKDLIANVSHDIKTPLTSIKAYAEMIKDISGDIPAKREEHLNVIIDETDYLNHLVTDMSELSRMQSGNYVLRLTNFDLAQKIRDVVQMNEVMAREGELSVEIRTPESLFVYADEIKIAQVINNFLTNAIKHSPAGKTIWVRAYLLEDEETVRVEVQDEGEGIDAAELPYIWDRYQKSSRSFSRSMTSTGLGLSIVKAILDTHHAAYGVESEKDHGSMFWFELVRPQEPEDSDNAA